MSTVQEPAKQIQNDLGNAHPIAAPPPSPLAHNIATKRNWILSLTLILIVSVAFYFIHRMLSVPRTLPAGLIQASGRMEGDTISVASKYPGRISEIFVREGDQVTKGQVLAKLEDEQIRAKVDEAHSVLATAESQLKAAEQTLSTARKEVPLSIDAARAVVEHAQAVQRKAEASEVQAERDAQRFARLADKGSVGAQRAEQAQLAWIAARSERESASSGLQQSQEQWKLAQLGWEHLRSSADQVHALESQVSQAKAALADATSVLDNLTIRSPINGSVATKIRDTGEVVAAGAPLYELVDLDRLHLKVYVPETFIGKLRLDLPGQVYTDAYPDQAFPAKVSYIADRAEFTPKEVQTSDERIKLVFAVKLDLSANPQHRLMPGMPADAVIRWKEGIPWSKPIH